MRAPAVIFGLCIVAVGVVGTLVPAALVPIAQQFGTTGPFLVLAVVRVAFGVLLVTVAATSRMPRSVRALGFIIVVLGLTTALTGLFAVAEARGAIEWWLEQSSWVLRFTGVLIVALGGFIAYACAPTRRAA